MCCCVDFVGCCLEVDVHSGLGRGENMRTVRTSYARGPAPERQTCDTERNGIPEAVCFRGGGGVRVEQLVSAPHRPNEGGLMQETKDGAGDQEGCGFPLILSPALKRWGPP